MRHVVVTEMNDGVRDPQYHKHPSEKDDHPVLQHQGQGQHDGQVEQNRQFELVAEVVRRGGVVQQTPAVPAGGQLIGVDLPGLYFGEPALVHAQPDQKGQSNLNQQRVKQGFVEHECRPTMGQAAMIALKPVTSTQAETAPINPMRPASGVGSDVLHLPHHRQGPVNGRLAMLLQPLVGTGKMPTAEKPAVGGKG